MLTTIHKNAELPPSVRLSVPTDAMQTVFREAYNSQVSRDNLMLALIKGYRALEARGCTREGEIWKDSPTVGDVHVSRPLGSVEYEQKGGPGGVDIDELDEAGKKKRKKDKEKDDPGTLDVSVDGAPPVLPIAEGPRDPSQDKIVTKRISGQSKIPLNSKGQALADKLGMRIHLKGGLDVLHTSDLPRAAETADAIAEHNPEMKRAQPTASLRPWNFPAIQGKQSSEVKNLVKHYIEHPDEVPQGGESFNASCKRQLSYMAGVAKDAEEHPNLKIGVVLHGRGLQLQQAFLEAGAPKDFKLDPSDLFKADDEIDHAGMIRWHKGKDKEVDLDKDDELKPGVFLILHSLTDDDTDEGNKDLKKYLPPTEVHRDAKKAYDAGIAVVGITEALAAQEGLYENEIQKIADHFAAVASGAITDSESARNAWGGEKAGVWAQRVLRKVDRDRAEKKATVQQSPLGDTDNKEWPQWIAVDLDKTLAEHQEGASNIGPPIPERIEQVKRWLDEGKDVRIFTARVADDQAGIQRNLIENWCRAYIGRVLPITNIKDPGIQEIWDDKAHNAEPNADEAFKKWEEAIAKVAGVQFTIGFPKGEGGSRVQSVIFDKDKWDATKAKQWLKDNNLKAVEPDETANTLRFRQEDPDNFSRFRVITPGQKAEDVDKFTIEGAIVSKDESRHLVFGFFSIVEINGKPVIDTQGDIITSETIEDSAYDFVLNARKAGEMHQSGDNGVVRGIGELVESVVFTKEKQRAMLDCLRAQDIDAELDLKCVAWWGGFHISSDKVWAGITSGRLRAFSVGGRGKRAAL